VGAFPSDHGGGILNNGNLTVTNMIVSGNSARRAGGVFNSIVGTLNVSDSLFTANTAEDVGGGFVTQNTVTIRNSTLSGNSSANGGGGIENFDDLTITNCTLSGNSAGTAGGGIQNSSGNLFISNSTLSGNSASRGGGTWSSGTLSLNSTIVGNNIATLGGHDIQGSVTAGDHNLIESTAGISGTLPGSHNKIGVDPKLGPLQDNGGPTWTHALLCDSPAIDAGTNSDAFSTDQRSEGFARGFDDQAIANAADGDGTDIGAFELQAPLVCNTAPVANNDSDSVNEDGMLNRPAPGLLLNDTDADGDTLTVMEVTPPTHGHLVLGSSGSFNYTPNANFNGVDSFTYKANDGSLDSNVATVTITVNAVNDAPQVSATPETQPNVQYSDAIQTVTINARTSKRRVGESCDRVLLLEERRSFSRRTSEWSVARRNRRCVDRFGDCRRISRHVRHHRVGYRFRRRDRRGEDVCRYIHDRRYT
jgi:VCBS repeat-containing protein